MRGEVRARGGEGGVRGEVRARGGEGGVRCEREGES